MSRNPLPDEWAELATKAGIRPTMSGIAEAIGKSASTVSRMIGRTSVPTAETVGQLAQALEVSPQRIWDMIGRGGRAGLGRWNPPEDAHEFDNEARKTLDALIRVMAKGAAGAPSTEEKNDGPGDPGVTNLGDRRPKKPTGPTSGSRIAARRRQGPKSPDIMGDAGENNQDVEEP